MPHSKPSEHVAFSEERIVSISLLTNAAPSPDSIMNAEAKVTSQIPCAVDSGACAHASPPDSLGIGKDFAADGSPIDELGSVPVSAVREDGRENITELDSADIPRPPLSINQIAAKVHTTALGNNPSCIRIQQAPHA